MVEGIADQVVSLIIAAAMGGVLGIAGGILISHGKFMKALRIGLVNLLRKEILDAYEEYVVERHEMSHERGHELYEIYEAYELCGGNGYVKKAIWPKLQSVNPYVVGAEIVKQKR